MLTLKEAGDLLGGVFAGESYIEMHAGLHTMPLYDTKLTEENKDTFYKGKGIRGWFEGTPGEFYSISVEAYEDNPEDNIYEINIVKRGDKKNFNPREQHRFGVKYYYEQSKVFSGNAYYIDSFKLILKQLGIDA